MKLRFTAGITLLLLSYSPSFAIDLNRPDVAAFIQTMADEHSYDVATLRGILEQAEIKPSIIDLISKPAEKTLTWAEYRPIFMTRKRVRAGAAFWRENRQVLECISADTGVPVEILVGIIGVETYFGRITGGHRVLDALATLTFSYPPRAKFFRGELEQFLLLVREEQMTATDAVGSYAGAMGRPQFMPSSYRAFAVDSTGDGKRDIWNDWADVAGSIANYFLAHGWKPGEEIATRATLGSSWSGPLPKNKLRPEETVGSLSKKGVMFSTGLPHDSASQLLTFAGADGAEHWVGFHNFFVITRYNHSAMYAMAVHQLGQEIAVEVQRGAP
ncbi:MAG: lytic murein transglycosylase B [Gammaproteobacteria bacterium]|nr:lytic murein transglycosylase B [Gammaproteobacteria bacterium]